MGYAQQSLGITNFTGDRGVRLTAIMLATFSFTYWITR